MSRDGAVPFLLRNSFAPLDFSETRPMILRNDWLKLACFAEIVQQIGGRCAPSERGKPGGYEDKDASALVCGRYWDET